MAVYPVASGYSDYGAAGFIPEIWSGKLLTKFYDTCIVPAITNTDYEGEIKKHGDTVIIRTTPDTTIRDYKKGQALELERPEGTHVDLLIDKGKYFSFIVDDIDAHQSDIKMMDAWSNDASEQMKIAIDTDFLSDVYTDVSDENMGATAGRKSGAFDLGTTGAPESITKANILDYIVDLGTVLDEQNVPETGRWIVMPAWMCGLLKKSDLKDASLTGDSKSPIRNGLLGTIDRFEVYKSNLVHSVADGDDTAYYVLAGHNAAMTFASQMTNMETLRAESTFGNIVRGLNVYGYKVIKPEALALLYAIKG